MVRLADRSDWWSVLNENFYWPIEKPADEELSAGSFEIAGIKLEHNAALRNAKSRLGRAVITARGSNSTVRQQVCYSYEHDPPIRLIFEEGDSNFSFYLFAEEQGWNGQALCAESSQVNPGLRTRSGLGLSMSQADVINILGKPDISTDTKLVYQREIERHTPDDKLAELRKEHAEMSEKDFHDNYDSYEVELYVEARFTSNKLTYLAVSNGESY